MSYDWRQRGSEEAKRAYYRWASRHFEEPEEEVWDAAFHKGAQWAVATTSAISPAVAAMVAFVDWVHEHELEQELVP